MEKKVVKINEGVYVLFDVLCAMRQYYEDSIPQHLKKELQNFLNDLEKELNKDHIKNRDIVECDLMENITFAKLEEE